MKRQSTVTFLFATIFSGTLLVGNIVPVLAAESSLPSASGSDLSPAELKREKKEERRLEKEKLKEERKQEKEEREKNLEELRTPASGQTEKLENPGVKTYEKNAELIVPAEKSVKKTKAPGKVPVKHEIESGTKSIPAHKPSGKHFSGNVSWYGAKFNGKKTASGEIFDMNKKTAAHRTLPFFTRVLVEDPKTGKTVIVKVNDRGPFVHTRVMDLSREGARQLGTLLHGTAFVDCLIVGGDVD